MSKSIDEATLLNALRWRAAITRFDPTRRISAETCDALEEALRLSPSSFGLQPWKFVLVDDPAMRQKLREQGAYGQAAVTDASHLVVLAHKRDVDAAHIDAHLENAARIRNVPVETMTNGRATMLRLVTEIFDKDEVNAWAARQTYIAFGVLITSAALLGIDACPMEGIDPPVIDRLLGLDAMGFSTLALCALGYRADSGKYATEPKVRFARDVVIEHI